MITEGEKKAAAACYYQYPCIGLGGVQNFRSRDLNMDFLPELDEFNWDRQVIIAYDSDLRTKKEVRGAISALTSRLSVRGASVKMLNLPSGGNGKVAIDDYLVAHGPKSLDPLIEDALDLTWDKSALADFNEQFIHVREQGGVWDRHSHYLYSEHKFKFAFRGQKLMHANPRGQLVQTPKTEVWLDSPRKVSARTIVCDPTCNEDTTPEPDVCVNTYRGLGVTPKRGKTDVWTKLLGYVFQNDKENIRFFEQWLAYPLQHPGTRLNQCVFIYGGQGVGKSAIGWIMLDIYGSSGKYVEEHMLYSNFNRWMEGTLFVLGDELSNAKGRSSNILKIMISRETIPIEPKGIDSYHTANLMNVFLTANQPRALPLDPGESNRRFFVIEAPRQRPAPEEWYTKTLDTWRRKEEGPRYLLDRLLKLDISGFNPLADAPKTPAQRNVVNSTQSNVESWVGEMPLDSYLPHDLYTARALYEVYQAQTGDTRTGFGAFTNTLTVFAHSCGQVYMGKHSENFKKFLSLWAIRHPEKYRGKKDAMIANAYAKQRVKETRGAKK
jgi:hypothetical protein